jgi:type IV secretion system protein VirD4
MFWKVFIPVTLLAYTFGFPIAEFAVHGWNLSLWPVVAQRPSAWFFKLATSYGLGPLSIYKQMLFDGTNSLGPVGRLALACIAAGPLLAFVMCFVPSYGLRRDPNGTHGDARWATRSQRRRMRIGLELGLDPDTGRPVRVVTESHLITIAPPRSGKTSGLVIPNLLAPENTAWFGPAVIFDPKGEIFRAVAGRRRELGRTVRCLDPIGIVGGIDTWNPLATLNPDNILHLQRIIRALLPDHVSGESVYFQNRAVDVGVGAFLAAHSVKKATPAYASSLLSDVDEFEKILEPLKGEAVNMAKGVLQMDAKGRDSILSTASQAFSWCADPRLQRLTSNSSFQLADLTLGNTDLFITLPVEDMKALTPLLRWLVCELFAEVRRRRPREPIVCFIDEAATLGRFDELVAVAGELPGHNLRLWTFWQDRNQIVGIYGDAGAKTLLNTAEIATYSDLPLIDPDERDFVSRAIGDYTIFQSVKTRDEKTNKTSVTDQPTGIPLLTAEAVGQIASTDLIVFPNCKHYAKRPIILRKTKHNDSRLAKYVTSKRE